MTGSKTWLSAKAVFIIIIIVIVVSSRRRWRTSTIIPPNFVGNVSVTSTNNDSAYDIGLVADISGFPARATFALIL